MWGEAGEIGMFPGIRPSVFGERGRGGFACDEFDRQFVGAVKLTTEFAEIGTELGIVSGIGVFGGFKGGFPIIRGSQFMGAGR